MLISTWAKHMQKEVSAGAAPACLTDFIFDSLNMFYSITL